MRILLIEDERRLANIVKKGLVEEGFAVDISHDGKDGKYMAELNSKEYDLIIMDIMLPFIDGISLCKDLRAQEIKTPILMLTAKTTIEDKITGLDSGADDYLTKPFAFLELKSRIHALIRRSKQEIAPILTIADLTLDPIKHRVTRTDKVIKLTPKEFSVLEFLLRNQGGIVSRTMLVEHVWDYNFDSMSNIVDVIVGTLRRKIDNNNSKKLIHTYRGAGYMICDD